jgi:hypothetical protein
MQTQTIENDLSAPAPAPAAPANDGAAPRHHPRSTESFVDAAIDVLTEQKPQKNRAREQVRRDAEAPEADEQSDAGEHGPVAEPEAEEQPEEQGDAERESAEQEEHDPRGSKDEPFTVKDLPKDKFIELKVDGERVVVSLEEMGAGYIREKTFTRWANKTKMLANEAQQMVQKARDTQERVRTELRDLLGDADALYDYFLSSESREGVFEAAARKYAELRMRHRQNPQERLAWLRQRDQERLNYERELFESQRRQEHEERQRKEHQERMRAVFQPGWEAGLRKAGFPKADQRLFDEVMVRWNQKAQRGEVITSDDVTEWVTLAARLLELPKQNGQKRPAPAPSSPRPEAPRRTSGKDPWAGKSQREKAKYPEYFLRNLRSRDFR